MDAFFTPGKKNREKMYHLGIFSGAGLRKISLLFENSGQHFYNIAPGISNFRVVANRIPKYIEAERTFQENLTSVVYL